MFMVDGRSRNPIIIIIIIIEIFFFFFLLLLLRNLSSVLIWKISDHIFAGGPFNNNNGYLERLARIGRSGYLLIL